MSLAEPITQTARILLLSQLRNTITDIGYMMDDINRKYTRPNDFLYMKRPDWLMWKMLSQLKMSLETQLRQTEALHR